MAAQSTTPLGKKLGLKPGFKVAFHKLAKHYFELFADLPTDLTTLTLGQAKDLNFIHLFCNTRKELSTLAPTAMAAMKKDGLLWISWPKGKSQIPTDLKRDWIREHLLDLGLVDVKVAAIDDDWSGLKFVYPLKDR